MERLYERKKLRTCQIVGSVDDLGGGLFSGWIDVIFNDGREHLHFYSPDNMYRKRGDYFPRLNAWMAGLFKQLVEKYERLERI